MTRARFVLLASAALILLGSAAARDDKEDAVAKELKRLEGDWRLLREESGGQLDPKPSISRVVIEEDEILFVDSRDRRLGRAAINLDPRSDPRTIDLEYRQGPLLGKRRLGIYRLRDGELEISWSELNGMQRPRRFSGQLVAGAGKSFQVFRRETDK
jgi:uncharacterized protein (TIGR03067 family)